MRIPLAVPVAVVLLCLWEIAMCVELRRSASPAARRHARNGLILAGVGLLFGGIGILSHLAGGQ